MFMQWGKQYKDKRPIDLLHLVDKDRDLIQNRYMYFRYFYICEIYLEDFIELYLPEEKNSNLVALLDINDGQYLSNKNYTDSIKYKMALLNKTDLLDYIPSMKCSKYAPYITSFKTYPKYDDLIKYIDKAIQLKAIVLSKI